MSEDYDVLSMSETDDYMETDASADGVGADETTGLSEADSSVVSGSENEGASDDRADRGGTRNPVRETSPSSSGSDLGSRKGSSAVRGTLKFDSMDSSQSISMYRLPRLSTELSSSAEGRRLPNKHWQLSCLDSKPSSGKRPRLIISVFGFSEELVREAINKLVPNMPTARFLWVHPISCKKELVASEFVAADKPFDSNPTLPTESDLKSRGEKLIHIFTYDVDADGLEDDSDELHACSAGSGKVWGNCPPSPVVPITAVFLGTNELNEKARIFASTDAPLLRSPDNVYTPLPIDCLDMLDEDMLLAMASNGTVARMTTPDKATIPALWPARLMPPSRKDGERPSYLWMALRFLTLALTVCMLCQGLMKYPLTKPAPGPKDIQVWKVEPEPSMGFFASLFHPKQVVESDLNPHAVSVAVAQSTSALVEYVKFLYLDIVARLEAVRQNVIFYSKEGRVMLDEALGSDAVRDLKLYAKELSELTGQRLRDGSGVARDCIKTTWESSADMRKRGSQKLAGYYRKTRSRATDYAKNLWSNAKGARKRIFADEQEWSDRSSDRKCSLKYRARRGSKRQLVFDCHEI